MDLKTLRLASIQLTEALLARYLDYQRVLVRELDKSPENTDWSGRFAFAHSHALVEAGLDSVTYGKLKALVGDFCSYHANLHGVRERLEKARTAAPRTPRDEALIARAEKELPALERDTTLADRYGAEAMSLLSSQGAEVLRLHREVARREGCTRV